MGKRIIMVHYDENCHKVQNSRKSRIIPSGGIQRGLACKLEGGNLNWVLKSEQELAKPRANKKKNPKEKKKESKELMM